MYSIIFHNKYEYFNTGINNSIYSKKKMRKSFICEKYYYAKLNPIDCK